MMNRYVAFLRGINVGGQKIITMDELTRIFSSLGFEQIKTYIQTVNVVFETLEADQGKLAAKIEKQLERIFESETRIALRTLAEIKTMVKRDPFQTRKNKAGAKCYVTFLAEAPRFQPTLPLISPDRDMEIFSCDRNHVFSLGLPAGDGRFGFPNTLIEREFGTWATTRNWDTLLKMLA
jgi:uncharacterized protein (DUF1697 family)